MIFKNKSKIFLTLILFTFGFLFFFNHVKAEEDIILEPCAVTEDGEATCAADLEVADKEATELQIASEKIPYVLFHLDTCPHCKDEIAFIESVVKPQFGDKLDIQIFEVSDPANAALYKKMAEERQVKASGVPAAFIGVNDLIIGYSSDDVTGKQIINTIEAALSGEKNNNIEVPFLGKVDATNVSLPLLTLVIGLLDGFNPCAMWVLLFLISLLLPMQEPKKRWLLGSIFILTSGISYYVFMAAWLELILFIGVALVVRLLIGTLAVGVGTVSLKDYWKNRKLEGVACKVSGMKGSKNIFDKLKEIVHRKNLLWSIFGITLLGFSVNLVELACSAGFPALFVQILALAEVTSLERYLYMGGYILFYMIDDMIVFGIAMVTLKATSGGNGKYAKFVQLVSGLLMLILGLLLIFKPEWLMFT